MSIVIGPRPVPLDPDLVARLSTVSFPTFGHYLEEGFADPGVTRQAGDTRVVGRAFTIRLTAQDSTLLHHAAGYVEAGDVVVIDTGGDLRHAPVGEILATALHLRGCAGIIVDGVVTDVDEIAELGIPVYARGRSVLTTKLLGVDAGGIHVPVSCGGVAVRSGDVVLADRNGVFFADSATLSELIDTIVDDDDDEPDLIDQLCSGARLGDLTGATATVRRLTGEDDG